MTEINLEFSRLFDTATVGRDAKSIVLNANEEERAALAQRLDLIGIESLSASLRVARAGRGPVFRVTGVLTADVVQRCVASLDPIAAHVEEAVDFRYGPADADETGHDLSIEFEDQDPPEPMTGDLIELGEPIAQFLSLALDPYPQLPDLDKDGWSQDEPGPEETNTASDPDDPDRENPFEVLATLMDKKV
jgi:uncharacterized metal-binding protein YceD (DUF177 family)